MFQNMKVGDVIRLTPSPRDAAGGELAPGDAGKVAWSTTNPCVSLNVSADTLECEVSAIAAGTAVISGEAAGVPPSTFVVVVSGPAASLGLRATPVGTTGK